MTALGLISGGSITGCAAFSNCLMTNGTVYLLPQYLTIVQGYDAFQTGQVMTWVGLPQLLIFPLVPRLMNRLDLRALVCFGTLIFAASCWMNTSMSHDYAGDQFMVSNIVRALGQPFTKHLNAAKLNPYGIEENLSSFVRCRRYAFE
jgi:Na+/melibiose symporter-like transporter